MNIFDLHLLPQLLIKNIQVKTFFQDVVCFVDTFIVKRDAFTSSFAPLFPVMLFKSLFGGTGNFEEDSIMVIESPQNSLSD